MEVRNDKLTISFDGKWHILLRKDRFGPFSSRQDALLTATKWATNARRQGHHVEIVDSGPPKLVPVDMKAS